MRAYIPHHRRAHQETVVVVIVTPGFAIDIVDDGRLRGVTEDRKILFVHVGHQQVIASRHLSDVVQAAVGVFFETAEIGQVVLPLIVVADTENTHADRHILKQEPAKVSNKRLDADAYRVEVEAVRDIAQMHVNERLLDTQV